MTYHNGNGGSTPVVLTGRSLAQRRVHMSASQLAVLAADWADGKIIIPELTAKMIIAIAGTNASYFYAALKLSDAERDAVRKHLRPLKPANPARPAKSDLAWFWEPPLSIEGGAVDHVA
jgi:hypothetical protein